VQTDQGGKLVIVEVATDGIADLLVQIGNAVGPSEDRRAERAAVKPPSGASSTRTISSRTSRPCGVHGASQDDTPRRATRRAHDTIRALVRPGHVASMRFCSPPVTGRTASMRPRLGGPRVERMLVDVARGVLTSSARHIRRRGMPAERPTMCAFIACLRRSR
jgi:hypothetical protein